ncbi:unnamed protein product [Rangifer tarandus platyrhynchus]|uniref:Uncharacterized protein n=1 Tax=Rangifer tarandus platyrhynchus TaxID=3082113 RepID=A0AC59YK32_RANTA
MRYWAPERRMEGAGAEDWRCVGALAAAVYQGAFPPACRDALRPRKPSPAPDLDALPAPPLPGVRVLGPARSFCRSARCPTLRLGACWEGSHPERGAHTTPSFRSWFHGSAVVTLQGQLSLRSDSARPRSVAAAAEAAAP